jgi:hypothetical protein
MYMYDNISQNSFQNDRYFRQSYKENHKHFMFDNFPRKSFHLYNVEKCGRDRQATDENIIWRMRIACWITKATDKHSELVILTAFPQQQCLRKRTSMLRYMYIASLVTYENYHDFQEFFPQLWIRR